MKLSIREDYKLGTSCILQADTRSSSWFSFLYLLFDFQLEVAEVFLQLALPLGSLLSSKLQAQLCIRLQRAHAVLMLIQQVLHFLLVHLQQTSGHTHESLGALHLPSNVLTLF